jgi:hypothetical protein
VAAVLGTVTLVLAATHRSAHTIVFGRYSTKFLVVLLLGAVASLAAGALAWAWERLPPGRLAELALALVSAAFAFVGFDLLLGRLWLAPSARLVSLDPMVHHRLQPGRHFVIWPKDYATWITVNADGYRGPERPRAKPAGVKRLWLSGDSFTLGKGVADDECFAALIEKRLNEHGPRYEVLNGGVDSYAPLLEYLDLEARGFSFHPDLVVLAFDVSDLWQEEAYHRLARSGPDGAPVGVDGVRSLESIPRPVRVERWLRRHSYFWAWALRRLDEWDRTWERTAILEGRAAGALEYTFHEDQTPYEPQWRAVEESLGRVVHTCRERGIPFALVTYPWGHQVNATEWARGRRAAGMAEGRIAGQPGARRLSAFAARAGVPFLDMTDDFRHAPSAPLYFREDMHWTAAGHRVAAASLYAFLVREGLVAD